MSAAREVALWVGGALLAGAAAWAWRRYGLGYSDGVPTGLVKLEHVEGVPVPAAEAATVRALLAEARAAGVPLQLNSAFRGMGHQVWLYAQYRLGLRVDEAARPGYSNHQRAVREKSRGPALDISVGRSADSRESRVLDAIGPKHGLKPVGRSFGEPWHFELVKKG